MKKYNLPPAVAGIALALALFATNAVAQGGYGGGAGGGGGGFAGGNFDPTQIYQTQADNMRDSLSVTNDDDWRVISPKLAKVIQLQAEESLSGIGRMLGGGRGGRGGGMRALTGLVAPDEAQVALQKAIDDELSTAEIKAAMVKLRESRKAKKAALAQARADLQSVLTVRQEAILLAQGLLE